MGENRITVTGVVRITGDEILIENFTFDMPEKGGDVVASLLAIDWAMARLEEEKRLIKEGGGNGVD